MKSKRKGGSCKKPKMYKKGGMLKDACWDNYKSIGTKKKGNKIVPNCVPKK